MFLLTALLLEGACMRPETGARELPGPRFAFPGLIELPTGNVTQAPSRSQIDTRKTDVASGAFDLHFEEPKSCSCCSQGQDLPFRG
jgi:hypothetical protein